MNTEFEMSTWRRVVSLIPVSAKNESMYMTLTRRSPLIM